MKLNVNYRKIKSSMKLIPLAILPLSLCACERTSEKSPASGDIVYEKGEHNLIEVHKKWNPFFGEEGTYALTAPAGYRVLDYDYDYIDDVEYHDYIYENTEKVKAADKDNFGIPVEKNNKKEDNNIYKPGEHNLVEVSRKLVFIGKWDETITLESIDGYAIVDYDYDISDSLQFENITYTNNTDVKVDDIDLFGVPVSKVKKEKKDYYDIGEHTIVKIERSINPFFGKDEEKTIKAPVGYEIIDYDYDKTDNTEFETIVYRNSVKVTKKGNGFGKPLEDINEDKDEAFVVIDRNLNLFYGYDKLVEVKKKKKQRVIDYDYDKNDSFEFETYVYKKTK